MKNLNRILLTILILATVISCEKDDDSSSDKITQQGISAKWVVDGAGAYESFEFNKSGNYIVVENGKKSTNEKIVHFGTYKITGDKTMTLTDFGKMEVLELAENSIKFSLTPDSDLTKKIEINATKKAEMAGSTRTDLLCRTWKMVSVDGESVVGTEMELTVLFSAAGTYFVEYAYTGGDGEGGVAQWTWKDSGEDVLCYSWDGDPTCAGDNEVAIPELTSTKLKVIEEDVVYILEAVVNKKSGVITFDDSQSAKLQQGFFRK